MALDHKATRPYSAQSAGKEGADGGRVWQPYADYLVYSVLLALPWGGPDLAEGAPAELEKLLESAEKYMELRPQQLTSALRPFFQGEDEASTSDSGAASFLGQVRPSTSLLNAWLVWSGYVVLKTCLRIRVTL